MKTFLFRVGLCVAVGVFPLASRATGAADRDLRSCFAEPPQRYWPRPLWFWNNTQVAYDVVFEPGRTLRCIHKFWNGRHIYFFANLNPKSSVGAVLLRGRHDLEAWDPHTGEIRPVQATYDTLAGTDFTRLRLSLPYLKSLFLVAAPGTSQ